MDYFDALETRDPLAREAQLFRQLPEVIAAAVATCPYYRELLADLTPGEVDARGKLAALPITRKEALIDRQVVQPPLGGLVGDDWGGIDSLFVSPGPLFEPGSLESSYWRLARALYATGFRQGQVIHNAFSYHATPGGWIFHAGARALGCPVIPAGTAPMELQLQLLSAYRPVGFAGVPDFLAALVKAAQEAGIPLPLERGLVSGGALTAAHLEGFAQAGLAVLQCYATAEVGLIAYETRSGQGLVVDEGVIVEIIDPQTDQPAAAGQVGEVVVTLLRRDYPLIRFATGDLSAVIPGPSPCGRTNLRLKGWLGRADQAAKVRGLFVRPSQIHALVQRQGAVQRARLIISRPGERDEMALRCEVASQGADPSSLAEAIAADLRALTQLRGEVVLMAPGELPDDGVLIEDTRR